MEYTIFLGFICNFCHNFGLQRNCTNTSKTIAKFKIQRTVFKVDFICKIARMIKKINTSPHGHFTSKIVVYKRALKSIISWKSGSQTTEMVKITSADMLISIKGVPGIAGKIVNYVAEN